MVSRTDGALCLGLLVIGQLEVWVGGAAGGSWAASLTLACGTALLLLRRRLPIAVAFGVLACQFVCAAFHEPDALTFGLLSMVAWYSVGRWARPRQALIALAVVLGLAVFMVDSGGEGLDALNLYLAVALPAFAVPWLVGYVIRTRATGPGSAADPGPATGATLRTADVSVLSPRERDVYDLLARGASNAEIAEALFLSIYTVKAHVASILAKLGLRDRVQVVVYANDGRAIPRAKGQAGPTPT